MQASSSSGPTWVEVRAVFPALAAGGLVPLIQAGFASTGGALWKNPLFLGACVALAAVGAYGLWQFVRHWGKHAIAPAAVAALYVFVALGSPPVYVFVALVAVFVVVCYFVSPNRLNAALLAKEEELQRVIRERDEAFLSARSDSVALTATPRTAVDAVFEAQIAGEKQRAEAAERERDEARARIAALTETLEARSPQFVGDIIEIQPSEPGGPDLRAALLVNVGNNGAGSVAMAFQVEARSVHGVTLSVQIAPMPEFDILLEDGRCIRYLPEHYIMTRTHNESVARGKPVLGVIPCIFLRVASIKEVDLLSLRVTFADGIGDENGKPKRWATSPLTNLAVVDTTPQRVWVGLPSAQPRT